MDVWGERMPGSGVLGDASTRGVLLGGVLGVCVAVGLVLAGGESPVLLPFAIAGGSVVGAVIGLLAALAAAALLHLGEGRVSSRVLTGSAAAGAGVTAALCWVVWTSVGSRGVDLLSTLLVLVGSSALALWQVRRLRATATLDG